ncbi:MAG: serine hydrolase, partial [Pseudomonadota bacterium]
QNDRVADVTFSGDPLTSEDYAKMGMPEPPETEVTEDALLQFNKPEVRDVPIPGGGGITNATSLALFYQALMHARSTAIDGPAVWKDETLSMVKEIRSGDLTDMLFKKKANRSLGLIISGDKDRNFRGFGHPNSPEAFGHAGAGGQIAWADPETGISFAYVTNGHDRNGMRQGRRGISISNAAAVCAL